MTDVSIIVLSVEDNPFIDGASGNYHLADALPGDPLEAFEGTLLLRDAEGNVRGEDGIVDVGALEYKEPPNPEPAPVIMATLFSNLIPFFLPIRISLN